MTSGAPVEVFSENMWSRSSRAQPCPAPALSSLRSLKILINRPEPEETAAELLGCWACSGQGRVAGHVKINTAARSTHRNESITYFTIGRKYQYILYPKIMGSGVGYKV